MHALQQKCRPKHQVLVLKCYPRTSKGAVDVKPNSSELSYLLFYATSRRTKIQKVGSFLEKKTASDVWRQRIGNVQVTLQILEALIEKSPKDLPLFAPSVLKILDLILRSGDITMVESSIPTFDAFCQNHDASSLFADQLYLGQYEAIVKQYASLASTREPQGGVKNKRSKPVALRWRNAGLEAIKSIAASDALSSPAGRQIDTLVPMILENLWTDDEDSLDVLLRRANMEEKVSTEHLLKRRNSSATARTAEGEGDPNPIALSGSAGDVEKMEEEDAGVLAIQCLKQIFVVPNRSQMHTATTALLRFTEERIRQDEMVLKTSGGGGGGSGGRDHGWAIKLYGLVARWAPMQERYVILVNAMDTMVRTPMRDDTLRHHIVLTAMMGSLLRSDVNLIGLSVMDVLLGLLQQMRRLLQMPGDPTGGGNGATRTTSGSDEDEEKGTTATAVATPNAQRKELLGRIQQTMGDLATHVYYNEQIIDMVSALLLRLKPSRTPTSTPHGEVLTDTETRSDEQGQQGQQHLESSLFSLTIAKLTALRAIKLILRVANPKVKMSGTISLSRYPVPMEKWDGTQWLLRDPDGEVRKAYVDALVTWLDRETNKKDLVAREDSFPPSRAASRTEALMAMTTTSTAVDARRARSVAAAGSYRDKSSRRPKSHFLHLLHVTIYDNALQFLDYDADIVLLHTLNTKLVMRLGVNAVRFGLPMIFRLQEDIQEVDTPQQKVRLGSLCHGYFWILTEKFDFDASVVGRAIQNEIIRRRTKHFWVDGVQVPAPPLDKIGTPGMLATQQTKLSPEEAESEALLPFDDRLSLVDCICTSYQEGSGGGAMSPPSSPPGSPSRQFSQPMLGSSLTASPTAAAGTSSTTREVPSIFKEAMLFDWSRDSAMAAIQAASKSTSLNGSRSGTNGGTTSRGRLGLNGAVANGTGNSRALLADSPFQSTNDLRPRSQPGPEMAGAGRTLALPIGGGGGGTGSKVRRTSGGGFVTSISHLKMVLSGEVEAPPLTAGVRDMSSSDDSMISYDMSTSDMSFNP
ncbi:hypothetical protein M406DRAFT_215858, partial [Cryphonectria parasitica EP155]